MKTILHAVHVHASPARVYEALTTAKGLSRWWTTKVTVEEDEGGVIRFTFAGDFHPHMKQLSLQPGRRVEWKCVYLNSLKQLCEKGAGTPFVPPGPAAA